MKQINDYILRHLTTLAVALLLVGLLCVPAVSAEMLSDEKYVYNSYTLIGYDAVGIIDGITFYNIQDFADLKNLYYKPSGTLHGTTKTKLTNAPTGTQPISVTVDGTLIAEGTANYNALYTGTDVTGVQIWFDFDYFTPGTKTGTKTAMITVNSGSLLMSMNLPYNYNAPATPSTTNPVKLRCTSGSQHNGLYIYRINSVWYNEVIEEEDYFTLKRVIGGSAYTSNLQVVDALHTVNDNTGRDFIVYAIPPYTWTITNPYGKVYSGSYGGDDSTNATQPALRTGTVTMTDNNGTTISGFEVTALNAYTGMEYTVSTDTDVAVITLPMDRTIEIRNPQTGEYEEVPVGYYRFYGQSSGYKMLNEDGIQVSVMPEKYGSYQLCDIRVTQESGYLTGKHQFQIRSRSDNSILQTGTISAKSATTGEWYNTSVSGGIASLILPYDTSNVQSQYAGNYYVYATSPGYKDSDYGTQIVVMPHTVSEIHNILLTPIGGIPPAGNVTLRIQVFSETGSGVRNAEIFIAGVHGAGSSLWDTYTASSTGYLRVSVPGNSTYDIVASGAGYYDSARRVEVLTEDPALIEIKLYLSGAPTVEPTEQPTGWVTPTPTQTTPPIQEDNIIGLSVKGLAKGFGIDYDTALLLFGLMIVFGAGGIVMSSVKGGAMEFIAGSIVGTFVAFALGLIPIWIFIIIVVVFGAYVLRVFVQGGQ